MIIYLIRHGETTSDIENLYGGDYDDHLTKKGRQQVKELAQKLVNYRIQIIFSSPRIRAKETSIILKESFNSDMRIINDIRERNNYGILTGIKKEEAKEKYPELVEQLKVFNNTINGAENYEHFVKRIKNGIDKIVSSPYEIIAIVTHGGPIRCLFREILKFGELSDNLADCAIIKLKKNNLNYKIMNMDGASLA